jgi:AraC-like DNA-binding protein
MDLLNFVNKIGYEIGKNTVQNLEVHHHKSLDFSADLAMFMASYTVKASFTRHTTAPKNINDSICFFFKNVTEDETPFVRVFPSSFSYTSHFKKNSRVKIVAVLISAAYLKSFLKEDVDKFSFLFETRHDFLIEEFMTDNIVRTLNDIIKPDSTNSFYYRLKTMELLFYLFQNLSKREKSIQHKLTENDIKSIYKVRDQLASSLSNPTPLETLKQIAGMNELKVRKLFTQIFGMGIYDYYQHLRMQEAARLIREERLSVSETGYRMGFENLSHFARIFEKHIGYKPKKYSTHY